MYVRSDARAENQIDQFRNRLRGTTDSGKRGVDGHLQSLDALRVVNALDAAGIYSSRIMVRSEPQTNKTYPPNETITMPVRARTGRSASAGSGSVSVVSAEVVEKIESWNDVTDDSEDRVRVRVRGFGRSEPDIALTFLPMNGAMGGWSSNSSSELAGEYGNLAVESTASESTEAEAPYTDCWRVGAGATGDAIAGYE